MVKKAVDVVLLPSQLMMDRAIELNRKLVRELGEKIVLNKQSCLPHISLSMGCIDDRDVGAVQKILKAIAETCSLSRLKVSGTMTTTNAAGEKVSCFEVENKRGLQQLHEDVMEKLAPFLSYDVTADMLYDPAEVAESTLLWIKNYRAESSFSNYRPHITLGYGQINNLSSPMLFEVSKLALCQLGNHCTCRKVLIFITLPTQP